MIGADLKHPVAGLNVLFCFSKATFVDFLNGQNKHMYQTSKVTQHEEGKGKREKRPCKVRRGEG